MKTPRAKTGKKIPFALRVLGLILRGFILIFLFLLAISIGIFFSLPRLMSGSRARAALTLGLQNRLHRPVSIRAVLATFNGLKIEGLVVGGGPQENQPIFEARSVLIDLNLEHLLDQRIEIGKIRLSSPIVRLRRQSSGTWNFSTLFSTAGVAVSELNLLGRIPISIVMAPSGISIEDGRLTAEDAASTTSLRLSLLNGEIKPLDLSRPTLLKMSFTSQGKWRGHNANADVSFQGIADGASFDLNRAFLRAEKFSLKFSSYAISGSWRLVGFKEPYLEASLQIPALGPKDWKNLLNRSWDFHLPPASLKINANRDKTGAVLINQLAIEAQPLSLDATGSIVLSQGIPQGNLFVQLSDFPLKSAADFFPPLNAYDLKGTVRAEASLSGSLESKDAVQSVTLVAKDASGRAFKSRARARSLIFEASRNFKRMSLRSAGAFIRSSSNTFSRLSFDASLINKKHLRVHFLDFGWRGSFFHLKGRLFPLPKPRIVAIAGRINKLDYEQVESFIAQMRSSQARGSSKVVASPKKGKDSWKKRWVRTFKKLIPKKFPNTLGRIHIGQIAQGDFSVKNVDLLWRLRGVTPRLNHLNGEAGLTLGVGEVKDIEALQSSHKLLKIIFLPYVYMHKMNSLSVLSAGDAYPKTLDFNHIEGEYGIRQGVITTRFSYVNGPELIAYADGKADFAKEKIDMSVLTRLTHYQAPLPEWWVDELGRPSIGFRVTGDLNHPNVEPRLSKIKAGEIEEDVKLGRQEERRRLRALRRIKF